MPAGGADERSDRGSAVRASRRLVGAVACWSVRNEHRLSRERSSSGRDDWGLESEGREQTVRVERGGESHGRTLELRRQVERVHRLDVAPLDTRHIADRLSKRSDRIGGLGDRDDICAMDPERAVEPGAL